MQETIKTISFAIIAICSIIYTFYSISGEDNVNVKQAPANEVTTNDQSLSSEISGSANVEPNQPMTTIELDKYTHDFGNIKEGERVSTVFKLKNTGNNPLIIKNVTASCGCTVPEWPTDPVGPGQTGQIKVEFNSEGKEGAQNNAVIISANTSPATTQATISANILKK